MYKIYCMIIKIEYSVLMYIYIYTVNTVLIRAASKLRVIITL